MEKHAFTTYLTTIIFAMGNYYSIVLTNAWTMVILHSIHSTSVNYLGVDVNVFLPNGDSYIDLIIKNFSEYDVSSYHRFSYIAASNGSHDIKFSLDRSDVYARYYFFSQSLTTEVPNSKLSQNRENIDQFTRIKVVFIHLDFPFSLRVVLTTKIFW
jgi:hypothetical protein